MSRACHMLVPTRVDSDGPAWTVEAGQQLHGGSMRTYLVVSQHTCKRAVNGSIPLGGSLGSDSVPGIGVFAFSTRIDSSVSDTRRRWESGIRNGGADRADGPHRRPSLESTPGVRGVDSDEGRRCEAPASQPRPISGQRHGGVDVVATGVIEYRPHWCYRGPRCRLCRSGTIHFGRQIVSRSFERKVAPLRSERVYAQGGPVLIGTVAQTVERPVVGDAADGPPRSARSSSRSRHRMAGGRNQRHRAFVSRVNVVLRPTRDWTAVRDPSR